MFAARYFRDVSTSNGLSSHRYFRRRFRRRGRRFPRYCNPRHRPCVSDRDRRFRDWMREKLRERERIDREDDGTDSETDEPEPSEIPSNNLSSKLHVTDLDLHIDENTAQHHTEMYECTEDRYRETERKNKKAELVIRRGQKFLMTINFDRAYDVKKNDVTLTFTLAASEGKSTVSESFKVNESKSGTRSLKKWSANVVKQGGKSLTVEVFPPASIAVGEWEVSVRTIVDVEDGKDLIWQYNHNDEINVLFNPWCKEDVTFMADDTWRNEAVMNDSGAVYYGTYRQIGSSTWHYGQFEDGILDAAFHLVRRGFNYKTSKAMGNAARIARLMSTMVNAPDDNGVLVGNWSDDFAGGVKPTAWTGSVKILRQYMRTGKPVKYAQCWVFSAVLTTVCRALGLPCRSLTNFESAHNADKDHLSHDVIYDSQTGETIHTSDSIWNFHVWNDVWMSRPDLGREYDGWQAIDATPQERSDGVFCCGPAPLAAIKEGQVNVGYDTGFVFAEVNADKVEWLKDTRTDTMKVLSRDKSAVGKKMSTHKPRGTPLERLDVTDQYKYSEGSAKEREVVKKAERLFRQDNVEEDEEPVPELKPVELMIEEKDDIYVGSGFQVEVTALNSNDVPRTINLNVKVCHKTYFGNITGTAVQRKFQNQVLGAGEHKSFIVDVPVKETLTRPKDGFNFHIKAVAKVVETDNLVTQTSTFRLRRPDVTVKGPTSAKAGDKLDFEVSFTNPLPTSMTNVEVSIEGNLKTVPEVLDVIKVGHIRPGATWKTTIKMSPSRVPRINKNRNASFGLESDQLGGIIGTHALTLS